MKTLFIVFGVLALTGCASITSEGTQTVRVEVENESGEELSDFACVLENDKGKYVLEASGTVLVKKSAKDLMVVCEKESTNEAKGTLISRAGAGMWGNLVFGGGIGAIIDHNKGTAYNYPDWVRLILGQHLTFDRSNHNDGKPTIGEDSINKEESDTDTVAVKQ